IAGSGPREYQACLEILCDDPEIDALLVIFIPPLATPTREVAQVLSDVLAARPNLQRPVAAVFFDPYSSVISVPVSELKDDARPKRSIPVYTFPEAAVAALAAAVRYGTWRESPTGNIIEIPIDREQIEQVVSSNQNGDWLAGEDVARLLGAAGINVLQSRTVRSAEEAQIVAKAIDAPVVLKVSEPAVLHKSDVGGVILNIAPEDVVKAYRQ